jgi:hypothetical protein
VFAQSFAFHRCLLHVYNIVDLPDCLSIALSCLAEECLLYLGSYSILPSDHAHIPRRGRCLPACQFCCFEPRHSAGSMLSPLGRCINLLCDKWVLKSHSHNGVIWWARSGNRGATTAQATHAPWPECEHSPRAVRVRVDRSACLFRRPESGALEGRYAVCLSR